LVGGFTILDTITAGKAHLSAFIKRALQGEEIIVKKGGKPVAVIRPSVVQAAERKPGALRGKIVIAQDFDELPPDIAAGMGRKD
jgi:antitoxin (DNA-binding transcriptional repressor) of toxin-antitoxin stability system